MTNGSYATRIATTTTGTASLKLDRDPLGRPTENIQSLLDDMD